MQKHGLLLILPWVHPQVGVILWVAMTSESGVKGEVVGGE